MNWLWVFLGGGTGAVLRWQLAALLPAPWGTVGVNILGSFLLAVIMHPVSEVDPTWKLALGTGLMGGLTTYSSFNLDVWAAIEAGAPGRALMIVGVTVATCLLGAAAGWWLAGLRVTGA